MKAVVMKAIKLDNMVEREGRVKSGFEAKLSKRL
jgi:hypothetical protein